VHPQEAVYVARMSKHAAYAQQMVRSMRGTVLPRTVTGSGVTLTPAAPPAAGEGDMGAGLHRPGRWTSGRLAGDALIEVRPLSGGIAELSVRLDHHPGRVGRWRSRGRLDRAAREHAVALRDALEGRPTVEDPAVASPDHRGAAAAWIVGGALVVVAVTALFGSLAPTPVDLETATERFRSQVPTARTGAEPDGAPATTADRGEPDLEPPPAGSAPEPAAPPGPDAPDVHRLEHGEGATAEPTPQTGPADPSGAPAPATVSASEDARDAPRPVIRPEPGVYRYATTGWEELSTPGSRRQFPAETTQTVVATECGYRTLWEPLEERSDELGFCVDGGTHTLVTVAAYREFYGHASDERFSCAPTARDGATRWSARCEGTDTVLHVDTEVRDGGSVMVGGRRVRAQQLLTRSRLEGATTGTRTTRSLVEVSSGLLLRTTVTAELTTRGPLGQVRYREEHRRELLDVTPHR
jgi:hypothetical protein